MRYAKVLASTVSIVLLLTVMPMIVIAISAPDLGYQSVITETTEPTQEPLINTPILFSEVGYEVPVSYQSAINQQEILTGYVAELTAEIASTRYTDEAISIMNDEIGRLEFDIERLQLDINTFNKWQEEYPVATEVWFYLRNYGYSEEVTAGIIGNMMIETSGGTLKLRPKVFSSSRGFYGLCQWSLRYYPKVKNLDTQGQLDYLTGNIEQQFKSFGFCYKRGFTYTKFLALDSPEAAALAFAKVYERCGSGSYGARKRAAKIAYEYFTLTGEE